MREEETKSSFEIENQWGKYGEMRVIKTTQAPKSKLKKSGEVSNTTEARKVVSKRTEKPSKERKAELVQNAKARVISNQADLVELKKASKKASKSFKASKEKFKKK